MTSDSLHPSLSPSPHSPNNVAFLFTTPGNVPPSQSSIPPPPLYLPSTPDPGHEEGGEKRLPALSPKGSLRRPDATYSGNALPAPSASPLLKTSSSLRLIHDTARTETVLNSKSVADGESRVLQERDNNGDSVGVSSGTVGGGSGAPEGGTPEAGSDTGPSTSSHIEKPDVEEGAHKLPEAGGGVVVPALGALGAPKTSFLITKYWVQWALSAIIVVGYYVLGCIVYRQLEGWDVLTTIYFTTSTITTVGYGDVSPGTRDGKLFSIFYIVLGMSTALTVVSRLAHHVLNVALVRLDGDPTDDKEPYAARIAFSFLLIFLCILVGTLFTFFHEGLSILDSLWWATQTVTSVGYGDIKITSSGYRLFCVFFILITVVVVTNALGVTGQVMLDIAREKQRVELMDKMDFSTLKDMDEDGDGVEMEEFVLAMLLILHEVSPERIKKLKRIFMENDVDGSGILTHDDLVKIAEDKMAGLARDRRLSDMKRQQTIMSMLWNYLVYKVTGTHPVAQTLKVIEKEEAGRKMRSVSRISRVLTSNHRKVIELRSQSMEQSSGDDTSSGSGSHLQGSKTAPADKPAEHPHETSAAVHREGGDTQLKRKRKYLIERAKIISSLS